MTVDEVWDWLPIAVIGFMIGGLGLPLAYMVWALALGKW